LDQHPLNVILSINLNLELRYGRLQVKNVWLVVVTSSVGYDYIYELRKAIYKLRKATGRNSWLITKNGWLDVIRTQGARRRIA